MFLDWDGRVEEGAQKKGMCFDTVEMPEFSFFFIHLFENEAILPVARDPVPS